MRTIVITSPSASPHRNGEVVEMTQARNGFLDLAGEVVGGVGFFFIIAMIVLMCCLADVAPAMAAEAAAPVEATSWLPLIIGSLFLLVGLGVIALGLFVRRRPLPEYDGRTRLRRDQPRVRIHLSL